MEKNILIKAFFISTFILTFYQTFPFNLFAHTLWSADVMTSLWHIFQPLYECLVKESYVNHKSWPTGTYFKQENNQAETAKCIPEWHFVAVCLCISNRLPGNIFSDIFQNIHNMQHLVYDSHVLFIVA